MIIAFNIGAIYGTTENSYCDSPNVQCLYFAVI